MAVLSASVNKFINFLTEELAFEFQQTWHKRRLAYSASRKRLRICFSAMQGHDASLWVFKHRRVQKRMGGPSQPFIIDGSTIVPVETALRDLDCRIAAASLLDMSKQVAQREFHHSFSLETWPADERSTSWIMV